MATNPYTQSNWSSRLGNALQNQRKALFSVILGVALIGFEVFNYSTTEMALGDLLGSLHFAGIRWATILAIAFCGIDFAGISRLFLPDGQGSTEGWYLLGAWFIAATMNAVLTWWSISLALANRTLLSSAFISQQLLIEVIPVFIAVLVWLTRILLIGTFCFSGQTRLDYRLNRQMENNIAARTPARPAPAARPFSPEALRLTRQANERRSAIRQPAMPARPEPEYVSEPMDMNYTPIQAANLQGSQDNHRSNNTNTWR
ncbi:MAG: hypothetical protein AB1453_07765 [Chloroflexota bacterium]|jgi:hypothetical protein